MKKLLVALLMLPILSFAQQTNNTVNKPVYCFPKIAVLTNITEKHKEKLVFVSTNQLNISSTKIALFSNDETGTWTLIEFGNEFACILGAGKNDNV